MNFWSCLVWSIQACVLHIVHWIRGSLRRILLKINIRMLIRAISIFMIQLDRHNELAPSLLILSWMLQHHFNITESNTIWQDSILNTYYRIIQIQVRQRIIYLVITSVLQETHPSHFQKRVNVQQYTFRNFCLSHYITYKYCNATSGNVFRNMIVVSDTVRGRRAPPVA